MDSFSKVTRGTMIPTEDPWAALQFCRNLAELLNVHLNRDPYSKAIINNGEEIIDPAVGEIGDINPQSLPNKYFVIPEISVVLPVYNEEENLSVLHDRLTSVMKDQGIDYEIIFVDDGSSDQSMALLENLAEKDSRVRVIQLSRNFGHQVAISAGLDYARGNGVVIMDADLQDPPEVLPQFIAKWREGYDVVYAVRQKRQENWLKRLAYASFYRLLRRVAKVEIPLDAGDFSIMDRRVVELLRAMPERNRFVRGIRSWVGLRQCGLPYPRQARHAGRAKYTLSHLMILALDGFISFSQAPLRLASLLGFGISLGSFLIGGFYFLRKIYYGFSSPSSGFTTLIVTIFFLGGVQLITIGVMGEYIGRIFDEVKQRPLYVVRQVKGF